MERNTTRRSVLRAASAAALLGATATTVQAASSDELSDLEADPECDCYTEYQCTPHTCPHSGAKLHNLQRYRRCCSCDSGTTCDDWQVDVVCCHYIE